MAIIDKTYCHCLLVPWKLNFKTTVPLSLMAQTPELAELVGIRSLFRVSPIVERVSIRTNSSRGTRVLTGHAVGAVATLIAFVLVVPAIKIGPIEFKGICSVVG